MNRHEWKDEAACLGQDVELFFDKYEEQPEVRDGVDAICQQCPVRKMCFANGITNKEWGIWGGVYLENGEISKEFNNHRDKEGWSKTWQALTMDQ
jgi:hypothetical protein